MIKEFVKKRWFTIALVLIVLVAIVRKNVRFQEHDITTPEAQAPHEIYTKDGSAPKSTALMHLVGDDAPARVRFPDVGDATTVAFLKRFAQVAVAEQEKFGMPASVLLACTYLNSFAGQRACATEANNYLAIRCTADWGGPVSSISGTCYRQYNTAWESIRDFNTVHSRQSWYVTLKKTAPQNWKAWVKAMTGQPVSDVQDFADEMAKVIEAYQLYELD